MRTFVTLLLTASSVLTIAYEDYDKVNHLEFNSTAEFTKALFNNPESKASTNILVAYTTPECKHQINDHPSIMGAQRHASSYSLTTVTVVENTFPVEVEGCFELVFYRYNSLATKPTERTPLLEKIQLVEWVKDRMAINGFKMVNGFDFPVQLYWCDENKEPSRQGILKPGESSVTGTYLGHIFAVRKLVDPEVEWDPVNPLLDWMAVKEDIYNFNPTNRLETCDNYLPVANRRFADKHIEHDCADMESRYFEFTHQIWYEIRQGGNFFQPKSVRPITEFGFEKRRLPAETYKWLKEWYDEEKFKQEVLEGGAGPCMNQNIAPTGITHITPVLKERLADELRDILEGWSGFPLEMTSIYGIRKYNNGSVLRMHVDTVSTHAVSTIINVDQKVTKDWPLIILDHDGNPHSVNMQAGDMLLYESAKCLHGRPDTFVGEHYDNIFVHYKPVTGWDYDWI